MLEAVDFIKMNPNQNATIIVLTAFQREDYQRIAKKLMAEHSVYGEQVGFLEAPSKKDAVARLQMMGDEFCANALTALSAYLAIKEALPEKGKKTYGLEISGNEKVSICAVTRSESGYLVEVETPAPLSLEKKMDSFCGFCFQHIGVTYSDMAHLLIPLPHEMDMQFMEVYAKHVLHTNLSKDLAVKGVTFFSTEKLEIRPLIYVRDTQTEVWEKSCGMATAALASFLCLEKCEENIFSVIQPSGETIQATVCFEDEKIKSVVLEQEVSLSVQGTAFI